MKTPAKVLVIFLTVLGSCVAVKSADAVTQPAPQATNASPPPADERFKLPGTQPNEHEMPFYPEGVARCAKCHTRTPSKLDEPLVSWQGSMMAQSARDPVVRAALAIANQDIKGSGEYCIRCHAPRGWFEGRSTVADGSLLTAVDRDGVSCEICHHLMDPFSDEAGKFAQQRPTGLGNGEMVLDAELKRMRGPYANTKGTSVHEFHQSPYHATSGLCGNCHNVSNPLLATNKFQQPPHAFGHIERTYSEWSLSDFAKPDSGRTCQSCHFPAVPGGGWAVYYATYNEVDMHRDYFVTHLAVGGSTWVQDAVLQLWSTDANVDKTALNAGKERAREFLGTAAAMNLVCSNGMAHLTITNLTGHKLPTGYPEGRRMWVNVQFFDANSKLIGELGRYGNVTNRVTFGEVTAPTLLDPEWTRVYECKPGISSATAAQHGKPPGPSFHFILNDVITKDNRIPPRGYQRQTFAEHLAAPVKDASEPASGTPPFAALTRGVISPGYTDGQYWDDLSFDLPQGAKRVEVRLMYQSVSWEYVKFLLEENKSDTWGRRLFDVWETTGKCPPEQIAFAAANL